MKKITSDYFKLIEELKSNVIQKDIIEILNVFDKIKLFWNKHKLYTMNEISKYKGDFAIIGGMTYPHFDENQYYIPLAHNKILLIDEPISKMDELIRIQDYNNEENMLNILIRTIDMFLKSKRIISNNNILIIPLRLYYGLDVDNLHTSANNLVYSILNYMFDQKIENDKDIYDLSSKYNSFDKIDELINSTKKDILFLGSELIDLPISERIKRYYKNSGLDFDKVAIKQSPILLIIGALYGYSAQICDIVNICEIINSDLYFFIEIPAFYFNIFLENIFSSTIEMYDKYLQTIIGYYLQKYLNFTDFNKLKLDEFCSKYNRMNLIELVKGDYLKNNCTKSPTDILSIKKFIEKRVQEFYRENSIKK